MDFSNFLCDEFSSWIYLSIRVVGDTSFLGLMAVPVLFFYLRTLISALHVWPGRAEEDDPLVLLALLSLPPAAAAGGRLGSAAAELHL